MADLIERLYSNITGQSSASENAYLSEYKGNQAADFRIPLDVPVTI